MLSQCINDNISLGLFSGLNIIKGRIKRDYNIIIHNHLAGKCICEDVSIGHYLVWWVTTRVSKVTGVIPRQITQFSRNPTCV